MTKKEQIRALQAECDRLVKERDDAFRIRATQAATIRRLREERDRSLPEQVRREFHAKWDWLLEAVGL